MTIVAEVIVDVTAREVDRPFDYMIPPVLQTLIRTGMRVQVSFGPRTLLGIVVGIYDCTDETHLKRLKPVQALLDLEPCFDDSLLALSKWMRDKYVCSWSAVLTAMLPVALRAETKTTIAWCGPGDVEATIFADDGADALQLLQWLRAKESVSLKELTSTFPNAAKFVRKWADRAWVTSSQAVLDRLKPKMVMMIRSKATHVAWNAKKLSVRKNAVAMLRLIDFMLEHDVDTQWPNADVVEQTQASRTNINALVQEGLLETHEQVVFRDPFANRSFGADQALKLTSAQQTALDPILEALRQRVEARFFLLQGVTGSGKTEVYLQAIASCIEHGNQALMLVPEISLTPQMVERFKRRFGDQVAVLHSRLSNGERLDEWRKILSGIVTVAVGARSALFAPFRSLGLIIIDEEHESTYKQEEAPRYHARDVAAFRAKYHNIPVVFGSATPALESDSWALGIGAIAEDIGEPLVRLHLPERVNNQKLPEVSIIDLREELKEGHRAMISRKLHQAILDRLDAKEQIVLMLNRRGYATFVMCRSCGHTLECPNCDVTLTFHQSQGVCRCHYCGYAIPQVSTCPSCESPHIRQFGAGTQKVEEELVRLFPGIRVIRMDIDTTGEKGAHEKLLSAFSRQEADVLLGTQMVAKGLDFPNVTLVGVISADTMLQVPDFRSAERTFQLLTQVAGRAGRHQKPGEVIIQSYTPEHYSIQFAAYHDVEGFLREEAVQRKQIGYPPYQNLTLLTFSHEQPTMVQRFAEDWLAALKQKMENEGYSEDRVKIFGPVAPSIGRVNLRYRMQGMIKYNQVLNMHEYLREVLYQLQEQARKQHVQVGIDLYPYHFG